MTPVDQTIFGDGRDGSEAGNCWAACLASLLDLPIAAVPNFCGDHSGLNPADRRWWFRTQEWLRPRGLWLLEIGAPVATEDCPTWPQEFNAACGLHVMSGLGPRGFQHCVVARAGVMIHDPHPSRAGLNADVELTYSFLVPLVPAGELRR